MTKITTNIGLESGAIILLNIWKSVAPSTFAASSSEGDMVSIKPLISQELNPIDPPR